MNSPEHEVSYILGGWTLDLFPRGVGINFGPIFWLLLSVLLFGRGFNCNGLFEDSCGKGNAE